MIYLKCIIITSIMFTLVQNFYYLIHILFIYLFYYTNHPIFRRHRLIGASLVNILAKKTAQ